MKEQIYTIPINSSFDNTEGCPLCRLFDMLEAESLDYSLSPAMMEPDVRQAMNKEGFCPEHYKALLARRNRLPLALVLESRLKYLGGLSDLSGAASGCYVCARAGSFMDRMYSNIVFLWLSHPEFRQKLEATELVCLPHAAGLLKTAKREAGKREYPAMEAALKAKAKASLIKLEAGVSNFCKSFDHRFADMELGDDRLAVERAINYLSGGVK